MKKKIWFGGVLAALVVLFVGCAGSPTTMESQPSGKDYYEQGDYDRAIAAYTQEIDWQTKVINMYVSQEDIDRSFASSYYERANLYVDRGNAYFEKEEYDLANANYDRAIADYAQAIATDLEYEKQELWKAEQKKRSQSSLYNQWSKAFGGDITAGYLQLNHAVVYNDIGRACIYKEDYNRAIASFTAAIEIDPNYAVAYALRSIVYEGTGNLNKAIDDLTQALVIDPDYQFAKDNLKRIRESQGI
jgi:tetratricopeptide (TPR) repeat protein